MTQKTEDNQGQETPTVTPVPFSPNTPGPPIKMIAIIAGIVLVVGALGLGVYFYFSNPNRPLNDITSPDEKTAEETPAENNDGTTSEDDPEEEGEENENDPESILEKVAFNVLEAESLSYTYSYNSTSDFALGISGGNPDGQGSGSIKISAEYRFQAVGLDDPDNAIIRQDISMTYDPQNDAGSTIVEFNVIRHQNDFYLQLFSGQPGQFLPLAEHSAIGALQDKWLKFTLEDGRFLELENGDLSHLEGTGTGSLLEAILREMITINADNREAIIIPLDLFATASYLDSPFVFGVADNRNDRRSIFRTMVGFGEGDQTDEPETIFAISGCEEDVGEAMTCQSETQIAAFEAGDILKIYGDLLDKANLTSILPRLTEEDFDQFLLDPEDVTDSQGEITVDLDNELPLLATSTTTFSAEKENEQTGGRDRISGQTSAELSYEGFNEDINLSLPTDLTPLSELR